MLVKMEETNKIKRIFKNTLLLYFRLIFTMLVSLYTSRIVLNTLGVVDYGIYNVVGGFVTMFGFLNGAMSSSTQRFLSFELGRKDYNKLHKTFIMSVNIHFIIALIIFILAETIGLWFVYNKLVIPPERLISALWVYHFSILSLMLNVISVPYNAMIIANERMNVYAVMAVIEVIMKLAIVFILVVINFDKLKIYAVLFFSVSLIISSIYILHCNRNIKETKYKLYWNKPLFQTLISFASWNLWGSFAYIIRGQGINVLLNMFFGPIVNAARGIAFQVSNALNHFVANFQMAVRPQIIKSYASDDFNFMKTLVYQGSKYSFFLLFILSLPILLETQTILKLWLNIVPEYTVLFTRLVIISTLIDSLSGTLMTAAQASGKIKTYQMIVSGILVLNLPVSYIFLKLGYEPQVTMYIGIVIYILALIARLIILRSLVKLKIRDFVIKVLTRTFFVTLFAPVLPYLFYLKLDTSIVRFIVVSVVSIISSIFFIYIVGLTNTEQKLFVQFIAKRIKKEKSS